MHGLCCRKMHFSLTISTVLQRAATYKRAEERAWVYCETPPDRLQEAQRRYVRAAFCSLEHLDGFPWLSVQHYESVRKILYLNDRACSGHVARFLMRRVTSFCASPANIATFRNAFLISVTLAV